MSDAMDRPFSRFYAELRRAAGEEVEDANDEDDGWLGSPKLANPRRSSDGET